MDFLNIAVGTDPTVVIVVKVVSTFVERHYQSLVTNIVEDPRANWNLRSVNLIISFRMPSTPQDFLVILFYHVVPFLCNWGL